MTNVGVRLTNNMDEMQKQVDEFISQFKTGYFSPLGQMARLTEEMGELAREISHHYGEKPKKGTEIPRSVEEEAGDVLFVLLALANSLDIDMSEAFAVAINKYKVRDVNRFERKEKIE